MQNLQYERSWDKAIAPDDRIKIEKIFQQQAEHLDEGIHFSFLWKAKNYKKERLVTVLIHNHKGAKLRIQNTIVAYCEDGKEVAIGSFDMPCDVEAYTTMPWTFIFKQDNLIKQSPDYIVKKHSN